MRDIPKDLATLQANMRKKYGLNNDPALVASLIKSRISEKLMIDIEQVIGSWTVEELIAGLDETTRMLGVEKARK